MSTAKVIEVLSDGNSIENALENALRDASKSVKNIKGLYVKDIQANVENNAITSYRINAKVTFVVEN